MTAWNVNASTTARSLGYNAVFCGLASLLPLALGPITAGYRGFTSPLGWLLLLVLCLVVLALTIHLLFDALLFRLASCHESEAAGLAAIDDTLFRMRLREPDATPRGLDRRIAGSRRIIWRQRCALAVCLTLFAILLLDATDGQSLC